MPVHLFGQMADMGPIMSLAGRHNLPVIEDAAQALGAAYKGRGAGSIGTFGTYSFFPSKNLGGFGEGGLLATNDDWLADKARLLRGHGAKQRYFHEMVGGNFRLDALRAALLQVKLPHLAKYSAQRQANAAYYTSRLEGTPGIVIPAALPEREHIWNQYTLRVEGGRRDALRQHLIDRGIGCEIYYPLPLHRQECFAIPGQPPPSLPVADRLAREVMSIPIYPELTPPQLEAVVEAVTSGIRLSGIKPTGVS
jgi:dTDP-4-amino-4,6-dideoxygalactose transaminase